MLSKYGYSEEKTMKMEESLIFLRRWGRAGAELKVVKQESIQLHSIS